MSSTAGSTVIIEPSFHSDYGASSAEIWLNCAGQINLKRKLKEAGLIGSGSSPPAAEGTAAHLVVTSCMEDGSDAETLADTQIKVEDWLFTVDKEMVSGAQETLDWARARIARAKSDGFEVRVYVEKGLRSFTDDEVFSIPDIIIHIVGDRLIVIDYKYGRGITVEPDSTQNTYYGYLGLENYVGEDEGIKVIESYITQPRIPHPQGTIRRHVTNAEEVTAWWFSTILPGIENARKEDAPLTVGTHCRWCPNKGNCPALKAETFEFSSTIDPSHMTDDEVGEALQKIDAIIAYQQTLEQEAFTRARNGSKIPGKKLVRKKSNRTYRDSITIPDPDDADERVIVMLEDAVFDKFGLDAYNEPSMRSPNQLEALDGGEDFTSIWAYSPDKGLTLAKESDKRMEIKPNIAIVTGRRIVGSI